MPNTPTTATAEGPLNPSSAPLTGRQAADLLPEVRRWLQRTAASWSSSHAANTLRLLDYLCQQEEAPSWAGASALKEAERRIAELEQAVEDRKEERDSLSVRLQQEEAAADSLRQEVARLSVGAQALSDRFVIAAQASQDFQKERDTLAARLAEAERQRDEAEKERHRLAVEVDKAAKRWQKFTGFSWAGDVSDAMRALIDGLQACRDQLADVKRNEALLTEKLRKEGDKPAPAKKTEPQCDCEQCRERRIRQAAKQLAFGGVPVGETKAMPGCDCEQCRAPLQLRFADDPPAPGTVWLAHIPGIGRVTFDGTNWTVL